MRPSLKSSQVQNFRIDIKQVILIGLAVISVMNFFMLSVVFFADSGKYPRILLFLFLERSSSKNA